MIAAVVFEENMVKSVTLQKVLVINVIMVLYAHDRTNVRPVDECMFGSCRTCDVGP